MGSGAPEWSEKDSEEERVCFSLHQKLARAELSTAVQEKSFLGDGVSRITLRQCTVRATLFISPSEFTQNRGLGSKVVTWDRGHQDRKLGSLGVMWRIGVTGSDMEDWGERV